MYRGAGILTLIVAALFVYFLAFTPFEEPIGRWTRPEEGSGFIQVKIECPTAWFALVEGERVDSSLFTDRGQCLRAARTHATGALLAAALGGILGVRGILRGPAPAPRPLRPLSEMIRRRREDSRSGDSSV
jgi:hypothetical protein